MRLAWLNPADLTPNPANPRTHPQNQRDALTMALDELGWISPLIFNGRTGRLIDGHLRRQEAMERMLDAVPTIIVDLDPEDEKLALASVDRIVTMATENRRASGLLADVVRSRSERLASLIYGKDLGDEDDPVASTPANPDEPQDPMKLGLIPGERFNYVVLVFKTELDWLAAQDYFGIEKVREPFRDHVIGVGRVIDGGHFLATHAGER